MCGWVCVCVCVNVKGEKEKLSNSRVQRAHSTESCNKQVLCFALLLLCEHYRYLSLYV